MDNEFETRLSGLRGRISGLELDDVNDIVNMFDGVISTLQDNINSLRDYVENRDKEITSLKAKNWDLYNKIPRQKEKENEKESEEVKKGDYSNLFED